MSDWKESSSPSIRARIESQLETWLCSCAILPDWLMDGWMDGCYCDARLSPL